MNRPPEAEAHALPSYEHEDVPSYEHAPAYDGVTSAATHNVPPHGVNMTIDPAGSSITTLPASDAAPLYTLNGSMLKMRGSTASIHVQRADPRGGISPLAVYAIGEHFISALLKPRRTDLRNVTVARSHGALVTMNVRDVIWYFSTRSPAKGKDIATSSGFAYPTHPVYMIGTGPGPGTVHKQLLQFRKGQVLDPDDEIIALERDGGTECGGMPVLCVIKELNQEMLDFLVSAWLVTLWGQVGKKARRQSTSNSVSSGRKLSIGKFKIGG